jgi:hypothetical protein
LVSDQTCKYSIIFHGESLDGDFAFAHKNSRNLYYQSMKLKYDEEFSVAVRGINTQNDKLASGDVWHVFKTPSCMEHHSENLTLCGPMDVKNFTAVFVFITDNNFNVNVSWSHPIVSPEYYSLELRDAYAEEDVNKSIGVYNYRVDGVSIERVQLVTLLDPISFFRTKRQSSSETSSYPAMSVGSLLRLS